MRYRFVARIPTKRCLLLWDPEMSAAFERYIGIDYSGAETCESSLKGLGVYVADRASEPREVTPPASPRKNWTRKAIGHWLVEHLSEPSPTLVGIDHGFLSRSSISRSTVSRTIGQSSWTIFKSIGRQMKPIPTSISFVKASAATARLALAILDGGESRTYGPERNPYFISMCLAPSPNQHTLAFLGCAFSVTALGIGFISGRSMAGRCSQANRQWSRFIRRCGVTASRAMAATPISRTPMPLRNGFAGATWMAAWKSFSIQARRPTKGKWPQSRAGFWASRESLFHRGGNSRNLSISPRQKLG